MIDKTAVALFGQTKADAIAGRTCIRCKLPVRIAALSILDRREYLITAICPTCWVALFPEDDPDVESHT